MRYERILIRNRRATKGISMKCSTIVGMLNHTLATPLNNVALRAYALETKSHAGTVVPELFKDDNASQCKSGKFDPRSLRNP